MPKPSHAAHAQLVLVRHGESTNNVTGRFTGWRDIDLTDRGREQARAAGRVLRDRGAVFSVVFTSMLRRAIETADLLAGELGQESLQRRERWRLNERHCGAMQGMTKDETYRAFGVDQARVYRRGWDTAPPPAAVGSGDDPRTDSRYHQFAADLPLTESMGDLWVRVAVIWDAEIRPLLLQGANVLIVGHGMALRALAKSVEGLVEPALPAWKLASAALRWYRFDAQVCALSIEDLGNSLDAPDE